MNIGKTRIIFQKENKFEWMMMKKKKNKIFVINFNPSKSAEALNTQTRKQSSEILFQVYNISII